MLKVLISVFIILLSQGVFSTEYSLEYPVNDYAHLLTESEKNNLNQRLMDEYKKTNTQIAILTINSLEGDSIEGFSMKMVEKYKLGLKGADNGVLFLISMKERKTRIEVGRGFEGTLTDLKSARILREVKPFLKNKDYNGGFSFIVDEILKITKPDLNQFEENKKATGTITGKKDIKNEEDFQIFGIIFISICGVIGYIVFIYKLVEQHKKNKEIIKTISPAITLFKKNKGLISNSEKCVEEEQKVQNAVNQFKNEKRIRLDEITDHVQKAEDLKNKLERANIELTKINEENSFIQNNPDMIINYDIRNFEKNELLTFLVKNK